MVFDKTGRQIEQIQIPDEEWTANVSFGGQDRRTLFITASKGLYRIRTRVRAPTRRSDPRSGGAAAADVSQSGAAPTPFAPCQEKSRMKAKRALARQPDDIKVVQFAEA